MIAPDTVPIPVRDVATAARYVRWIGLDPDLAHIEGERWTVPSPAGDLVELVFAYGAADSPLTAEEWGALSVALVRSIPTEFSHLGPTLLATMVQVVGEAVACRAERSRLSAPREDLDDLLDALVVELAEAEASIVIEHGDLIVPDTSFRLTDAVRALVPEVPFPLAELDPMLKAGFFIVEDALPGRAHWGMLRHEDGAAFMVRVVDGVVEKSDLIEGPDAIEPWTRFGTRLTPDASRAVRIAAHPGTGAQDAISAIRETGLELRPIVDLDAGSERTSRFFIVDQREPRRRQAMLVLVVGAADEVFGRWLIEGEGAVDQLARLLRAAVVQGLSSGTG